MRRLPVYILIQTSGAMRGEPVEAIKVGLETMTAAWRQDPFALESVHISMIAFSRSPQQLLPLTSLEQIQIPPIAQPVAGGTHLGEALEYVCKKVDQEVKFGSNEEKGDWMPLLYVLCDGRASDQQLFMQTVPEVKRRSFASIIACLVGNKLQPDNVKLFADTVVQLDTADGATFRKFFKWVSDSVGVSNRSLGAIGEAPLPPPPPEVLTII
ncbi:MAG: tellurium resistance protein TerY [Tannerellaceae bacterium]|nr:tellurium resistance protein TerY [Tannerellaceae bacterium]